MKIFSSGNDHQPLARLPGCALKGVYVPLAEVKAATAAFIDEIVNPG